MWYSGANVLGLSCLCIHVCPFPSAHFTFTICALPGVIQAEMNDVVALPFQVPQAQDLLHHTFSNQPNIITNSPESIPHIIRMAPPDPLPADPRVLAAGVPRSKNWPWYQESIGDKLTPTVRVLLEDYSGIPSEDVESHVYQIVCAPMRSSSRCN